MDNISGEYRYWLQDKPIPEGWEYICELAGHHNFYSFLIKKIQ